MSSKQALRGPWRIVLWKYLAPVGTGSPVIRRAPGSVGQAPSGLHARRYQAVVWNRAVVARRAGFAGAAALAVVTFVPHIPTLAMLVAGLLAMAVLVGSWLAIGTVVRTLPVRWLYGVAAGWSVPLLLGRPLFSGDVWSYTAQGLITATTGQPYRLGPLSVFGEDSSITGHVASYWLNTPAPYGPAWEALSNGLALVGGSNLLVSVIVYRVIAVLGVLLIAWALPRLAQRVGAPPAAAVWLGLLNPLVLWHFVSGAHNDAIMMGLVMAGLEVALSGLARSSPNVLRIVAGFTLLVLATNVKIIAAGAVSCLAVYVARRIGRSALVTSAAAVGGLALTTAITLTSGLGFGWFAALNSSSSVHSWMAPTNQVGALIAATGPLFGTHLNIIGYRIAIALGAAAGAVLSARVLWRVYRGHTEPLHGLGLLFLVMLICGPVVQPWYVLWAVLPIAASARLPKHRIRVAIASAVIALALPPAGAGAAVLISGYLIAAVLAGGGWWLWRRIRPADPPTPAITPGPAGTHLTLVETITAQPHASGLDQDEDGPAGRREVSMSEYMN